MPTVRRTSIIKQGSDNLPVRLPLIEPFAPEQFHSSVLARRLPPKFKSSFAAVHARFLKYFFSSYSSRADLEAALPGLGIRQVKQSSINGDAPWYHPLCTLCKYLLAEPDKDGTFPKRLSEGNWYSDQLPLALELSGWYFSSQEIRAVVEQVRQASKEKGNRARRASLTTDPAQIWAGFVQEAASLEAMVSDPLRWSKQAVRARAKGQKGHWLHAARAAYVRETGRRNEPYLGPDGLLAWLARKSGLLAAEPDPEAAIRHLLGAIGNAAHEKVCQRSLQTARSRDPKRYVQAVLRRHFSPQKIAHPEEFTESSVSSIFLGHASLIHFIRRAYGSKDWDNVLRPALLHDLAQADLL